MNKIGRVICVFSLSIWTVSAFAAPYGMIATSRITEPCILVGTSGGFSCGPGITNPDIDDAFGSGIDTISVSVQHPGEPNSNGSAAGTLDIANLGLPELSAYAQSAAGDGTFVEVEAINLYTYTGPDNFNLELTSIFHGTTTGFATVMFGQAALISTNDLDPITLMNDLDMGASPSACFGECYDPLDFQQFFTTNGGEETFNLTLGTTVNNGDQFYIWAEFGGYSVDGGVFNGLSTASLALNTSNVEIASAPVPLPGALPLLASALAFSAWMRRRIIP